MTVYDYILIAILVAVLPAEALWKTLRAPDRPKPSITTRLLRSIRVIVVLTAFLAVLWWWAARPIALLGLDLPVSTTGLIGLGAAAAILGLLAVLARSAKATAGREVSSDLLPRTQNEKTVFVGFALAAGIGWELLYRGYLLWALTPWLGTAGAVTVAAIGYGLGHGSKGAASLAGAVVSSFLFTIAYALTGSLWWLMLLHAGLPLILMLSATGRAARPAAA